MNVVYLILLTLAAIVLLLDAFAPGRSTDKHFRAGVRLLPLALFFWVLVPWLQFARLVF